jgi:hypothetical protein
VKRLIICILLALSWAFLLALQWPSETRLFNSFFAQKRDNVFNSGIIFEQSGVVRAADYGKLLVTLETPANMIGFPSTLGNAIITMHDDGLMTVYGNLEDTYAVRNHNTLEAGAIIGISGNSGWQQRPGGAEFQVIDTEKKRHINPLMLLPEIDDKIPPVIRNITAVNQSGTVYSLGQIKSLPRGTYRIYGTVTDRVTAAGPVDLTPFRTVVMVNGTEVYASAYEILHQEQGRLFLENTRHTGFDTMYTDTDQVFLAPVTLSHGRTFISVTARDISGNERTVSYNFQAE